MHATTRSDLVAEWAPHPGRRRQIGLLVFDGVEELDAVGPWEVLSNWTQEHPEDGWDVFTISADGAPVVGAKTLVLGAHHSIGNAPRLDVLIHPGGPGTRPMLTDRGHLDWIREQRASVPLMTSVCTGSSASGWPGRPSASSALDTSRAADRVATSSRSASCSATARSRWAGPSSLSW